MEGLVHRKALQGPAWFQFLLFFDTPQSLGEEGWDKKGNKVLDRKVNHKLGRETQF